MFSNYQITVLALCAAFASGCSQKPSDLEGRWAIDLSMMKAQAIELGATQGQIRQMERTYEGAILEATNSQLVLSIDGQSGKESMGYTVIGKQGNCFLLKVNSSENEQKYCVHDRLLEVHDPSTKLVATYRRM